MATDQVDLPNMPELTPSPVLIDIECIYVVTSFLPIVDGVVGHDHVEVFKGHEAVTIEIGLT